MVFAVLAQVLREMVDLLGEQRDLHFGGTGVPLVPLVRFDDFAFALSFEHMGPSGLPHYFFGVF
jgi:hypothetical protein